MGAGLGVFQETVRVPGEPLVSITPVMVPSAAWAWATAKTPRKVAMASTRTANVSLRTGREFPRALQRQTCGGIGRTLGRLESRTSS